MGRLLTDETLTSIDDDRIVAAGDCAAPSGVPYRMCCAAAQPLGAHAADTVLRRVAGAAPRHRSIATPGQCLSLGREAGVLQLARRDDSSLPLHVGGRSGARLKEGITAGTLIGLRAMARRPGLIRAIQLVQDPRRGAHLPSAGRAEPAAEARPSVAERAALAD